MTASISHRATAVAAYGYHDFPVQDGDCDLRGDNSPALATTTRLLSQPDPMNDDVAAYGDITGHADLRTTLADLFGVRPEHVIVTAGGSEALHLALTCVADPGDTVLLPRPAFPGFDELARLTGLRIAHYEVPGAPPRRRHREPLLVCTPHNPTGVISDPGIVLRDDGWTIWDISHMSPAGHQIRAFTSHMSPAGHQIRAFTEALTDHDIVVFSLSKLLRLPGARVGCLVTTHTELLAAMIRAKTHLSMSTNRLGQRLATRILRDPATSIELGARTAVFAGFRKRILDAAAASNGLTAVPATDGTHVWLRTHDGGDAGHRLAQAGVIGLPGVVFHGGPEAVRLCIAQPELVIHQAADRIAAL